MVDLRGLVGMDEAAAKAKIRAAGMLARVIQRDEEHFMGTCDFRTDRVNLVIKEGKVVRASKG